METKFTRFLRTGGNGEYLLSKTSNGLTARQLYYSVKSEIAGYTELQDLFSKSLDRADQINRDLILQFTAGGFEPRLAENDLSDISEFKDAAIGEWDQRVARLWAEWSERPDRFHPCAGQWRVILSRLFQVSLTSTAKEPWASINISGAHGMMPKYAIYMRILTIRFSIGIRSQKAVTRGKITIADVLPNPT